MKIYLPENLDLHHHVKQYPQIGIPKFAVEKLALLLGQIIAVPANNKRLEIKDGFIPLSATVLKSLVREYCLYMNYAATTGMIIKNNQYVVGEKCRGYKFDEPYNRKAVIFKNQRTNLPVTFEKKKNHSIDLPKKYKHLAKPFLSGELILDKPAYEQLVQMRLEYLLKNPDKIIRKQSGEINNPFLQYNSAIYTAGRFADGDIHMSIDSTVGRLHTNLTNMPSSMRNFLKYGGEDLVCIDMATAQIYLSNILVNPLFYEFQKELFDLKKKTFPAFEKSANFSPLSASLFKFKIKTSISNKLFKSNSNYNTLIMLVNMIQSSTQKEFQRFSEITSTGSLYNTIVYESKQSTGNDLTRDDAKKTFFKNLYSDNRSTTNSAKTKWTLSTSFPSINKVFYELKRNDKTVLPCLLQSLEAFVILDCICKRIHLERPEIPIFTIHDSIVTTVSNEEYLKRIMVEELTKFVGLPPTLHTEHLRPDNPKLLSLPFYRP